MGAQMVKVSQRDEFHEPDIAVNTSNAGNTKSAGHAGTTQLKHNTLVKHSASLRDKNSVTCSPEKMQLSESCI